MVCDVLEICRYEPQCKYKNCSECRKVKAVSNVKCAEKRSKYILHNPNKMSIIEFHVDGGLIYDEENCPKCDYLYDINTPSGSAAVFVELKGKHYRDALRQIENSIRLFKAAFRGAKLYARIVCSNVPNIKNNPQDIKLEKAIKKHGVQLRDDKKEMTESVQSLLV